MYGCGSATGGLGYLLHLLSTYLHVDMPHEAEHELGPRYRTGAGAGVNGG